MKELLTLFPVRKTETQKRDFREWLVLRLHRLGYGAEIEGYGMHTFNVLAGKPKSAKIIFTAHYDTGARSPFPGLTLPTNPVLTLLLQLIYAGILLALCFVLSVLPTFLLHQPQATVPLFVILLFASLFLLVRGPANKNNANSNSSGVAALLAIAEALPKDLRKSAAFVFFDNGELGLTGASKYKRKHIAEEAEQIFLNFDCVGDGDRLLFLPGKNARSAPELMQQLAQAYLPQDGKTVKIVQKGLIFYPTEHRKFKFGIAVAACRHRPLLGDSILHIHTNRDTILDENNINLLREGSVRLLEAIKNQMGESKNADL